MQNKDLKQVYNNVYSGGSTNFYTYSSFPESLAIIQLISSWANLDVLDIGCGEGRLAAMLCFAEAKKVKGIDYSKEAIEIANSRLNLPALELVCQDYVEETDQYDVVILQGVLEHMDNPWETLQAIMEKNVKKGGSLITSSPSFVNPRGFIWMALKTLLDVPMSLSDIHYLCPHDFEEFAEKSNLDLEMVTVDQDWGNGERLLIDFQKRLPNALRDAGFQTDKVEEFLRWVAKVLPYQPVNEFTGATMAYKLSH